MTTSFAFWTLVSLATAQMDGMDGMGGMGGFGSGRRQRAKEAVQVKADVKLIECDACEMAITRAYWAVEEKRAAAPKAKVSTKPGKKVEKRLFSEDEVNDVLNEVCHRRKKGGEWLWFTDLVEVSTAKKPIGDFTFHKGLTKAERKKEGARYLLVAETPEPGKWDHERASLRKACENSFESMDVDDLAVALWKGEYEDPKSLVNFACKEMAGVCKSKGRPPIKPPDRVRDDAPHDPQDSKLVETEQMMQNMEEAGSPMVMQSREDLEDEMRDMAEDMGMTKEEMDQLMSAYSSGAGEGAGGDPAELADSAAPESEL